MMEPTIPETKPARPTGYRTHERSFGTDKSIFEPTVKQVLPSATRADLGVDAEIANGRPWVPRKAENRRRIQKRIKRAMRNINEAAWAERAIASIPPEDLELEA